MRTIYFVGLACSLPCALGVQEPETESKPQLSPNKKWEYRILNDDMAALVKVGEEKPTIELAQGEMLKIDSGKLVWAPDSRRFAFNFREGADYYSFELYELAGTTWKKLPDVAATATTVTEAIERSDRQQLRKLKAPKDATVTSVGDTWQVLRWLDDDTFLASAASESKVLIDKKSDEPDYFSVTLVFNGKCDNRGGWKATSCRAPTKAEMEEISKTED
jgi:hypothetical protein